MDTKLRFWAGAAIGAGLQYLFDPRAGAARRVLLRDQITEWVLSGKSALSTNDGLVAQNGKRMAFAPFQTPSELAFVRRSSSRAF